MAVELSKSTSDGASKSVWHCACFKCRTCQLLLVDLCYCYKAGGVYCERHYAELIRPRCRACDEVRLVTSLILTLKQGRTGFSNRPWLSRQTGPISSGVTGNSKAPAQYPSSALPP